MATQDNNSENVNINTIKRHYSDEYIQQLTKTFYQFICDIYIIYRKNDNIKNKKQNLNSDGENSADNLDNQSILSDDFIKYLMLQFYKLKGIKRKNVGENIVLLSYDKDHDNYNPDDNLTKLCRHIILDTSCLRIISLGIPRRNNINTLDTSKLSDFNVEIQYDGSMVIYNPSLKNNSRMYQERDNRDYKDNKDENSENGKSDENEVNVKTPIDVSFSTRKIVGTSNFNTDNTFKNICLKNFGNLNFDLNKLDNGFESLAYVFNVMDQVEHISNDNINLLVSCYQFKDEKDCATACKKIISITNINDQSSKLVNIMFQDLAKDMIKSLDIREVSSVYPDMKLPDKLDKDKGNITKSTELIKDLPYTYKGITIWDQQGARYKLANSNFEKMRDLRGNLPINLSDCNNKSLFKVYLRLKKQNEIDSFLSYFDRDKSYKGKFVQFKKDIQEFNDLLHQWYLDVYVQKNKVKDDIPSYLYPLCYELHGLYMSKQSPITRKDVLQYLYDIDVMSLYGRIYTPIPDLRKKKKDETQTENQTENQTEIQDETQDETQDENQNVSS